MKKLSRVIATSADHFARVWKKKIASCKRKYGIRCNCETQWDALETLAERHVEDFTRGGPHNFSLVLLGETRVKLSAGTLNFTDHSYFGIRRQLARVISRDFPLVGESHQSKIQYVWTGIVSLAGILISPTDAQPLQLEEARSIKDTAACSFRNGARSVGRVSTTTGRSGSARRGARLKRGKEKALRATVDGGVGDLVKRTRSRTYEEQGKE